MPFFLFGFFVQFGTDVQGGFRVDELLPGRAAQALQFVLTEPGFQPDGPVAAAILQANQSIVEHGLQWLPLTVEQLHLDCGGLAAGSLQPDRFLLVRQKAVPINAEADPPAAVTVAQILKGGIPDQPIEHQRLLALLTGGWDRHDPGSIRRWLSGVLPLPKVQSPLQGSSRCRDRLPPRIGSPGAEAMAPRSQVNQRQAQLAIGELIESDQRLVIHLNDHMGADAKVRVPAHRPVLHGQDQLHGIVLNHAVIAGAHQRQLRPPAIQLMFQLLNRSRWCHLLKPSGGTLTWNWALRCSPTTEPSRQCVDRKRGAEQEQQGQNSPQQQLQG